MANINERNPELGLDLATTQRTQKIVNKWIMDRELKSLDIIPQLYAALFNMPSANTVLLSEVLRTTNAYLLGSENTTIHPEMLRTTMYRYTDELDQKLAALPSSPLKHVEDIVHTAAWAYYVFEKIHPFTDGNGRIGRMIVKKILKGAGFRDIIFHDQRWYGNQHSDHLDALSRTDKTGNLSHVELYLLTALRNRYSENLTDVALREEINQVIDKKHQQIANSTEKKGKHEIWLGFPVN